MPHRRRRGQLGSHERLPWLSGLQGPLEGAAGMILVPALADIERLAGSKAERTFARLLKNVEGDPDAVAFYSVRLREHAYKQQAEADFVILWKRTVVVVEVKGGGVR